MKLTIASPSAKEARTQIKTSTSLAEVKTEGKRLAKRRKNFELTPEIVQEVEECGARGLTIEETAHCVGLKPSIMYKKEALQGAIREGLMRGRARGLNRMTGYLIDQAEQGNAHAVIFYLKNRAPDTWANDVNSVSKIQINLARISDSELLTELREDEALANVVDQAMIEIDTKGTSNVHHVGVE